MAVKEAKSIAEYAFRKWMVKEGFVLGCFELEMTGTHEAIIRDKNGDSMKLVYDSETRNVFPVY